MLTLTCCSEDILVQNGHCIASWLAWAASRSILFPSAGNLGNRNILNWLWCWKLKNYRSNWVWSKSSCFGLHSYPWSSKEQHCISQYTLHLLISAPLFAKNSKQKIELLIKKTTANPAKYIGRHSQRASWTTKWHSNRLSGRVSNWNQQILCNLKHFSKRGMDSVVQKILLSSW